MQLFFNINKPLVNMHLPAWQKGINKTTRLTHCCTQFKSHGVKILCELYLHYNVTSTFKWCGNFWNKTFYSPGVWIGYNVELAEYLYGYSKWAEHHVLNIQWLFFFFEDRCFEYPSRSLFLFFVSWDLLLEHCLLCSMTLSIFFLATSSNPWASYFIKILVLNCLQQSVIGFFIKCF